MPLYEYECSACGSLFEQRWAMGDDAPACPSCSSEHVLRRISMFAASTSSGGFRGSAPSAGGGGCACGGSCMCGAH
ncbi:MAG TPA: zinc ribbon domain-containing protein [Actinomycetota bacterium]